MSRWRIGFGFADFFAAAAGTKFIGEQYPEIEWWQLATIAVAIYVVLGFLYLVIEWWWGRHKVKNDDDKGGSSGGISQQAGDEAMNVASVNQSGGQTAGTIHNYYGPDPTPRFHLSHSGADRHEHAFSPHWKLVHVGGEVPEALYWRFRGPYSPAPDFRTLNPLALDRTHMEQPIDLTGQSYLADDQLQAEQVGFELKLLWRAAWHFALYRFSLVRIPHPNGMRVNVDLGDEIVPPLRWVEAL